MNNLLNRHISHILKSLAALLMLVAVAPAAEAYDGSTAYNFLDVTSSARIYGLGGVNITTIDDDISTADQNPALLGPEMSNQIGINYMRYLGDSNFAGINYAHSAGERGAWGVGIRYFGYGSIRGADENGVHTGDFSPKDVAFTATYSHDFTDRLRGGASLKFLYSGYESYTAFAIATDLGINYYDPEKDLSLSAVVANLGGQVKRFNEHYDRLPIDVRLGWSQSFGGPIRLSITAWNLTKWRLPYYDKGNGNTDDEPQLKDSFASNLFRHLIFAADWAPNERFYVTLAYNYKTRTDMSTYSRNIISGFSIGAGLNVRKCAFSLAFAQPHSGALTLMFNLRLPLDELIH